MNQQPEQQLRQQQYKAFAGKGWNARTQTYSEIKLYTLEAQHVQMNSEIINYYEAHPNDLIIFTRGDEDKRVATIHRESRFPAHTDHIVIPLSLNMKTCRHVPSTEIDLLEQECQQEGIRFAGQIQGITPIREILQNTSEESSLHPIVEDVQRTYSAAVALGLDTKNSHSNIFTEFYRFHEKNCNYWNCPIHNSGELKVFKYPKYFLAGESESHPWVIRRNNLETMIRRANEISEVTKSIMMLDSLSKLSSLDDDDDEFEEEDLTLSHDNNDDDDDDDGDQS